MFRLTIRTKFTVVLLLFALASVAFVGYAYSVAQDALEERIGRELERQAASMMSSLDRSLYERYRNIQNWSNHEILLDTLTDDKSKRISDFLTVAKEEYGLYSDLVYANNSGKIIAASNEDLIGVSVFDESWFRSVAQTKEIQTEGLQFSKLLGSHAVTFAIPAITDELLKQSKKLSDQGYENQGMVESLEAWKPEILGVLAAFIDWSEVIEEINTTPILGQAEQSEDAYAMLIDQDALILTQPFFEQEALMFHENLQSLNLVAVNQSVAGHQGFSVEKSRLGGIDFIGYAASKGIDNFSGFGWSVLVFQSESMALAPIKPLLYQIISFGAFFVLVMLVTSIRLSGGMAKPIIKLVEGTKKVAGGDFSANIEVKSKDEIGTLASAFNDMTRTLEETQSDLSHANKYADNIIRSTVDCMFVMDQEGIIQRINPAVTHQLQYEQAEVAGKLIRELIVRGDIPENDLIKRVRISGIYTAEMEFIKKDESTMSMLVSATPMKDEEGKEEGVVVIAKDVTEYKSLEQQFHRAQRMDAVGRLAGGIAHDFNNMLTIILGYSEKMLRKMPEEDKHRGEVGQVLKAGKRAAGLVRQLLTFSRRQIVKAQVIDLNELLVNMHKMLKHMTGENIEVVALPAEDVWPIKIDPGQFEQVIANLTVNARDAMPDGGKIVLTTRNQTVDQAYASSRPGLKLGNYVVLGCQDTGTGMTEEVKKKIFEPFFTTKGKDKGTGLGLATCYGMVKQAGGYIDVETEVGKGTTFLIYLPKSDGQVQSVTDTVGAKALPKGSETILLCEDEELVRELARSVLAELGYTVIVSSNGSEALLIEEESRDKKIDLLLTDVVMPKMGGRELAQRMAKLRPDTKILFMSGYVDDDEAKDSIESEEIQLLEKPITPTSLAIKIREVIDGKPYEEEDAETDEADSNDNEDGSEDEEVRKSA